jgi:ABC-type nitrate/sulfonate/bicarbonate transport system substrate-binding protein
MTRHRASFIALAALLTLVACNDDSVNPPSLVGETIPADQLTNGSVPLDLVVTAGQPFPADRCAANQAAGPITYLSSFDFTASASIVDVLVAQDRGYFEALCLDVIVKPSFSSENYPLVAGNEAQFSSGGSFGEVVAFAGRNAAGFVTLAVEGRTGIDTLLLKPGVADSIEDLRDTTIGVKGKITPSVQAMLQQAGLIEGDDYETVLIDGFDPKVHIELPDIVGFPGYKSNEPLQLEAAGIEFDVLDPADYDIPGSFGVLYTNAAFLADYPTAAEDFIRATLRGLADAMADPEMATDVAMAALNSSGGAFSRDGELARWKSESAIIKLLATPTMPPGKLDVEALKFELESLAEIGLFDTRIPLLETMIDEPLVTGLYDSTGTIIWPGK